MIDSEHTPLGEIALALPYRGRFGEPRPAELHALPLPPAPMPWFQAGRPLKRWRYVGFFSPELIVCLARVHVGPVADAFWAVWDRRTARLRRGSGLHSGRLLARPGRAAIQARGLRLELELTEEAGIETVCACGRAYSWTRKQAGVPAQARLYPHEAIAGFAVVDDTAAYYERHTEWRWSAGVGESVDGAAVAWNLVSGVGDPPTSSERTVWVGGEASEVPPCHFAQDLTGVDELRFTAEATLRRRVNLGLIRSRYVQPVGTFSGRLPGGLELARGLGVMEHHDAWW